MLQKRKFQIVSVIALICLLAGFLPGCNGNFVVKTHHGFMSPDVYELTNGDISIKYYNGNCCCIAKDVLIEMKSRIEKNEIIIDSLNNKKFVDNYLQKLCNEMRGKNSR